MKIVINTAHQRFGGAVQVALSFINECRKFPQHEYHVWVGPGLRQSLVEHSFPHNFTFQHFNFGAIHLGKIRRIQRHLQHAENRIQPDVIVSVSGPTYFHSKAPQLIGYTLPFYIYPESPYVRQWSGYRRLRMALKKRLHFYYFKRDSAAFVVQTDDVNQRLRKALDVTEVYTVTNTSNGFYDDPRSYPRKLPERKRHVFRFLTLSAFYPHKNLDLIPELVKELDKRGRREVEFVLTLKPQDFGRSIGKHPRIHNVEQIDPEEGPSLYQECDGMFLPTLAECFSASYPEAMKMKRPIVTTDLAFARSICGDAALYFAPQNACSAATVIEKLVSDGSLRKRLIAEGEKRLNNFDTPHMRARKYLTFCETLACQPI